MSGMDNGVVVQAMYSFLLGCGLKQNREKFTLPEAGHRGYSVDVGSSYGEVAIRIINGGRVEEVVRILKHNQVEAAQDAVARSIGRKRELMRLRDLAIGATDEGRKAAKAEEEAEELKHLGWDGLDSMNRSEAGRE